MPSRRSELGHFLRDRRSRVQPADVGLPAGPRRRVAGLRREEVATLAGVGVTWYTRLENGTAVGVSAATLSAIARALQMSPDETAYLNRLAEERSAEPPQNAVSELTRGALDAIEGAPAYVCTTQWTVLAWNRAMTLVWGIEPPGGEPFNIVARMFTDRALRSMHGDNFPTFARRLIAMVRSTVAWRMEDASYLKALEELRCDPLFAAAWDGYDIATQMRSIGTRVHSVAVGAFAYQTLTLDVPDDVGHFIVMQIPDAPSSVRLRAALCGQYSDAFHAKRSEEAF